MSLKKLMIMLLLAGAAALPAMSANAFWGGNSWMPWNWFDDDDYYGGPWGYPGYGYGYPGYGWGGYPGYYGGYPGYGWGGYPGYYGGYPGYGYGGYPGYGGWW